MVWRFYSMHQSSVGVGSSTDYTSMIVTANHSKPLRTTTGAYYTSETETNTHAEPCKNSPVSWRSHLKKFLPCQPATAKTAGIDGIRRGWRKAMISAAITTAIVLAMNIIFAAVLFSKYESSDGVGTLYEGDCGLVKRWDTVLHLLINILGTVLLAASSFTMQCLSSPTRKEVDAAHKNRRSLEIGSLSVKNLFRMRLWKAVSWICLCLSTMPLHLLWNSAIFSTGGTNLFSYIVVEKSFLTGASYTSPMQNKIYSYAPVSFNDTIAILYDAYLAGNLSELTPEKCLNDYTKVDTLTARRNLILVVQTPSNNDTAMSMFGYNSTIWNGSSVLGVDTNVAPDQTWLENLHSTDSSTFKNAEAATRSGASAIGNFTIETCWSEATEQSRCKLQFGIYIFLVVIICNSIKLACIASTTRYLWNLDEPILATVGDAVASFLDRRDETTHGWCLLHRHYLYTWQIRRQPAIWDTVYDRKPRRRLYSATTATRWRCTMCFCIAYIAIGFGMFMMELSGSYYTASEVMNMKFGAVNANLILGLDGQSGVKLIRDVIFANSFQLALSATYFAYNSLYTAQCAALEWASYAQGKRKGLRVTRPQGQQRSTYWLQLPYTYSIPLTILSMVMHFLVSQSIFLARLQYYDSQGILTNDSFTDVGYSPRATLTTCCLGTVLILAQIANALRPLNNRIPIHGNSSAIISAACHVEEDALDQPDGVLESSLTMRRSIATLPIMWGVTRQPIEGSDFWSESEDYVPGHCSFSANVVEPPVIERRYE